MRCTSAAALEGFLGMNRSEAIMGPWSPVHTMESNEGVSQF